MFKIMQQVTSSGTSREGAVSAPLTDDTVRAVAWNTADVDFAPVQGNLERPLSAIAAMAVDLGPADLSANFRKRRAQ